MLPTMPQRRSAIALRRAAQGEGTRTIVIALIANLVIGIAKLIGGLVSGSSGMLAEAAHSAADSVNEIFLAVGLHRDRQPPDAAHPDGHGRERFLWAFMAAIASFLIGGCLSIALAIAGLKTRHPVPGGLTAWIILAVSFTADGASWLQSMRQARGQAKEYQLSVWRYIIRASDPVVRAVVFEDSAACDRTVHCGNRSYPEQDFRVEHPGLSCVARDRVAALRHRVRPGPSVRGFPGRAVAPAAAVREAARHRQGGRGDRANPVASRPVLRTGRSARPGQGSSGGKHGYRAACQRDG